MTFESEMPRQRGIVDTAVAKQMLCPNQKFNFDPVTTVFDTSFEDLSMYEGILLPTDGSETAARAIEQAIDITRQYEAALHVLYVVDETAPTLNVRGSDALLDRLETEGDEVVDEMVEQAEQASISSVTGSVHRGEPAQTILDYVDTNGIDLVVMGTHGRNGLDRHLLGSVTEKVVRHADASVLTVRKTDAET